MGMAKILICDDSRATLSFFERKLKEAGHEIAGKAMDGEQGLKAFLETKPDVTLLDVTMPNKDGRECLESILSVNPHAKVIMVSAVKDDAVVKECLKAGAKTFISKAAIYNDEEFKKSVVLVIDELLKAA
jgi:two-component system, chemotaxis family, chemotaxis protein CheY